jgi:hypothetical protein
MNIDIYIKKTNKTYKTEYGIPFECIELIRRFFSININLSFPDVIDAIDFFYKINSFFLLSNPNKNIFLDTYSYPYTEHYSYYLRPGSILFWKYNNTYLKYGHVALIIKSNKKETVLIQQNLNPAIKKYNTQELFEKINNPKSKFLGIKILSNKIISKIDNIECNIIKL